MTDEERTWLADTAAWMGEEGGYIAIQGTRPQTLGFALNDSPVVLLAWIVEKWRVWSDCDGDLGSCFTPDELLTNATIYWVTGSAVERKYDLRRFTAMPRGGHFAAMEQPERTRRSV